MLIKLIQKILDSGKLVFKDRSPEGNRILQGQDKKKEEDYKPPELLDIDFDEPTAAPAKKPVTEKQAVEKAEKIVDKAHEAGLNEGWQEWLGDEIRKENERLEKIRKANIEVLDDETSKKKEELLSITREEIDKIMGPEIKKREAEKRAKLDAKIKAVDEPRVEAVEDEKLRKPSVTALEEPPVKEEEQEPKEKKKKPKVKPVDTPNVKALEDKKGKKPEVKALDDPNQKPHIELLEDEPEDDEEIWEEEEELLEDDEELLED